MTGSFSWEILKGDPIPFVGSFLLREKKSFTPTSHPPHPDPMRHRDRSFTGSRRPHSGDWSHNYRSQEPLSSCTKAMWVPVACRASWTKGRAF